ncbi:hypothetical protein MMC11_003494 [Xylographa trunciseda]|nr:hypothetical protein [Xylographa trunciseda]
MDRGYGYGGRYGGGGYGGGGYGGGGYGGGGYVGGGYGGYGYGGGAYEEDEYEDGGYGGGGYGDGGYGGYGGGGYACRRHGGGRYDEPDMMGYDSEFYGEDFDEDSDEDDYHRMSMSYPGERQRGLRTWGLGGRRQEFGLGAGLGGGPYRGGHRGRAFDGESDDASRSVGDSETAESFQRFRPGGRGRDGHACGRGGRAGVLHAGMRSGVGDSDIGGSTVVDSESEGTIGGGYAGVGGLGGRSRGHGGHGGHGGRHGGRHGGGLGGGHRRSHGGGNGRASMGNPDLSDHSDI